MQIGTNQITAALCAILFSSIMMLSAIGPAQATEGANAAHRGAAQVATPSAYLA